MKNDASYDFPPFLRPQMKCVFGPHQLWMPGVVIRGAARGEESMREAGIVHW